MLLYIFRAKETHQIAEANQEKNKKLKEAFGISDYYVDGSSFDPNRKAKEAEAKAKAMAQKKYAYVYHCLLTTSKYRGVNDQWPLASLLPLHLALFRFQQIGYVLMSYDRYVMHIRTRTTDQN